MDSNELSANRPLDLAYDGQMAASSGSTAGSDPVPLRLVNTVGWRFDAERRVERLPDADALLAWATGAGVLSDEEARALAARPAAALEAELERTRDLREAAYEALAAHVESRPPPPAATAVVHHLFAAAVRDARPSRTLPLTWEFAVARRSEHVLSHRLALAVAGLLASPDLLSLLGRCANEPCGWLFLDRTRSHTRRFCSSTGCGNSERARRHYARHHGGRRSTAATRDTPT
jgi:predicted RNA-binding Zn ribbon-like protein